MRRALVVGLVVVAGSALAGCGSGEKVISTNSALAVFRKAGFPNLIVLSNKKAAEQLGLADAAKAADMDTIVASVNGRPALYGPLLAVRLQSVGVATDDYAKFWAPKAIRAALKVARAQHVVPPGFDLRRFRSLRVCNLLLQSYNAHGDPGLSARFSRAVRLLQARC